MSRYFVNIQPDAVINTQTGATFPTPCGTSENRQILKDFFQMAGNIGFTEYRHGLKPTHIMTETGFYKFKPEPIPLIWIALVSVSIVAACMFALSGV